MKLRTKIFIIFLTLSLIPLIIITIVAYSRYTSATHERMTEISRNIYENALNELDDTLEGVKRSVGLLTFYPEYGSNFSMIELLKQFSDAGVEHDNYAVLSANNDIRFLCQNIFYSYDYIYSIYIFTPSGVTLSHTSGRNGDLIYGYSPAADEWYHDTVSLGGKLYVSPAQDQPMISGHKESLLFAQAVYDIYSHDFLGVVVLDCNPSVFDLSNINTMPDITLFQLMNTNSNTLMYDNSKTVASPFTGRKLLSFSDTLSIDSLLLTVTFDYDALYREFSFTGILLILIALVCAAGTIILSYILSKQVTYPIEHLSHKMSSQNGSHLTLSGRFLDRTDEIGTLYNEYNFMVEELNASIKKDYEDKLITLDAQMRSLEAQINSHFLFNTLESINSLAELDEDERISTMVLALGNMFRYSIKTKSELVSISDEIAHVQDYISIQKIRFDEKFRFFMNIPPEMGTLKVLKLILQPLVENALYHGLNYCTFGDEIEISGYTDGSFIWLSVTDNGTGMSEDELHILQERLKEKASFTELGRRTGQSIGLKNIQSRIELYYGQGYGLSVDSTPDKGTQIQIKLPLLTGN